MKKLFISLAALALSLGTGCAGNTNPAPASDSQPADTLQQPEATGAGPVLKTLAADVAPAEVFNTVAAQYAGSVVFVDFWATWCPPCRQAMKLVDAIKPTLMAKGCKFVYITGETSPRSDFDEMFKGIDGDHFYLTDAQYKGVLERFGVEGIPHYVLLDRKGNVVWQHTGYPGNDEVVSQVEGALAQ
ncbi:MAG: TlpA family protein disulfide reductase [Bacteroidaceae bacterium]|nr:TlpA family protein disulfide reductase [Bacteroidaceae bacterium]